MTTIPLPKPHRKQRQIIRNRRIRFRVVACGRRFGKTEVGKREIVRAALIEHKRCWWLSPTYLTASQVWRDLKTVLIEHDSPTISETERRIDLPGGGMIAIRSTHLSDNLRGAGLDFAVLDEAAYMESTVWPEVVRPMLLDSHGGALFLSTPRGRNWFWELYKLGLDPEETDWASFHFTSYDNPLIDPAELDAIHRITPESVWNEEYLAQFLSDSGHVFRRIREAATAPVDAQPTPGARYVAGIDWGRENDFTVIVILDTTTRQVVAMDRFNQIGWAVQRGRLKTLCDRWNPAVVWAEANSIGAPNIEALQAEGLPVRPFTTTAASKKSLIEGLALALERGDLALLPDEVLLGELASYRMERSPNGFYRYSAPAGAHDDCVIALALAWHGTKFTGPSIDFA